MTITTREELVEAMAEGYCTQAMRDGFHVDQQAAAHRLTAALKVIEDAGWMVVPVDPTNDMAFAGYGVEPEEAVYDAMLQASPLAKPQ